MTSIIENTIWIANDTLRPGAQRRYSAAIEQGTVTGLHFQCVGLRYPWWRHVLWTRPRPLPFRGSFDVVVEHGKRLAVLELYNTSSYSQPVSATLNLLEPGVCVSFMPWFPPEIEVRSLR